jgi:FkbM family methyltransferase
MKKLLKAIYDLLPFKRELFLVIRALWPSIPERYYRHLHFKLPFRVRVDETHAFRTWHIGHEVENSLFWKGLYNGWEKVSIGIWAKLCRRADVVFDIGANTGVYALIAKSLRPGAKVYAFEPVPRVFERLQRNIRLNRYEVECVEKAVSDRNGKALIYDLPSDHIYSVTVNKNLHPAGSEVIEKEIETIALASFIESRHIDRIDLMKIDVETHEPEVLKGMGPYLEKFRPTLLIEVLNDEVAARIEPLVQGLGYLYFNIDENKSLTRTDHITHSDYFNYLLCDEETAKFLNLI